MRAVIQSRMQTTGMIGSCRELQWNMQSESTTARSVADHQCATTRTNSLHPPPLKIKLNRRFNALAKKVQNTFDTKHKKRLTHYKDIMRPQQAIRSNTEHMCTTMFIRRGILRVFPFVTRIWQPHTNSIPGCFIRPGHYLCGIQLQQQHVSTNWWRRHGFTARPGISKHFRRPPRTETLQRHH